MRIKLSPSSMDTYANKCGHRFYLERIAKVEAPVGAGPALVQGRCLAVASEVDLGHVATQMNAGASRLEAQDLPLADVQDATADEFARAEQGIDRVPLDDGTVWEKHGPPPAWDLHNEKAGVVKDRLLKVVVPTWYEKIAPTVEPKAVEHTSRLVLDEGENVEIELRARLDVLPHNGDLADLKSTSKATYTKAADAEHNGQLTAIDIMYRLETGQAPTALGWDTVKVTSKGADVVRPRVLPRTDEQIQRYLERVRRIAEGIAKGVFIPADKSQAWQCSPTWCPLWRVCRWGEGTL